QVREDRPGQPGDPARPEPRLRRHGRAADRRGPALRRRTGEGTTAGLHRRRRGDRHDPGSAAGGRPSPLIRRILSAAVAVALTAGAVLTTVVAAAFALYALLEGPLGRPGAAAVVAALAALVAAVTALIALRKAEPPPPAEQSPMERVIALASEKPILAVAAALAAGVVALRNPKVVAALVSAFVA